MKTWTKMQKEGQNRLTGLERGKPCKKSRGKRQKMVGELCRIWRERKVWKELLKSKSEQVKSAF